MQNQPVSVLLKQLELLYPGAFKRNYLLYSQLKTKGMLDERKELIPWVLALMIFVPISYVIQELILSRFEQLDALQAHAYAILSILLFQMAILPIVIKQIRHSSHSLYQFLRHSPLKLAVVIILFALNTAYLHSPWIMWILFFFGISFSFVRIYKENLFKAQSELLEHYQLQQLRRVCFWAYKQAFKTRLKLRFMPRTHPKYDFLTQQLKQYAELYTQMLKHEQQYCKNLKHLDLDSYMDEML